MPFPFNLSLDLEEESEPEIITDFFDSLPKELESIVKDIRQKSKNKTCPSLKNDGSGAFGTIEIGKNNVKKVLQLMQKNQLKTLVEGYRHKQKKSQLFFLINRLNNYCDDIRKFVSRTKKYFPYNFLDIYKCNLCNTDDKPNQIYVEMGLGKGQTFAKILKDNLLPRKDIESIIIQVYYICIVLNRKKIYHNDLKPANIIIGKTKVPILYDSMNNKKERISMSLPREGYHPIIVDYDLTSLNEMNPVKYPDGAFMNPIVPDFSFFLATISKINKKYDKFLSELPDYLESKEYPKNLDKIFNYIKDNKVLKIKKTKF